jgi:hypothetical protein
MNYAFGIHKNNSVRKEINTANVTAVHTFNQRAISVSSIRFYHSHKLVYVSVRIHVSSWRHCAKLTRV